jgi:hypothetical protein
MLHYTIQCIEATIVKRIKVPCGTGMQGASEGRQKRAR